ncbi:DUF362 domain-containing protein [bacterium]|nr:DUF362 domain-containing protein [bacterium]
MERRTFLALVGLSAGIITAGFYSLKKVFNFDPLTFFNLGVTNKSKGIHNHKYLLSGQEKNHRDTLSHIYESKNGTPEQNMAKVLEMIGGIEKIIGKNDIVVIKPNGQQIMHNMTNTNTIKEFVDQVLSIPGFSGEVIVAENHHYHPDDRAGWTTTHRNGDYNLNELIAYYHDRGIANVTKYHWRDGGIVRNSTLKDTERGRIVSGPGEGDGYVWTDEEYSYEGRKTKMTYPIFTSAYSGVTIDFKNGAWKNGKYTGQPVKFINMSALRHHSNAGVTAAIKNYLGVVDLTCGYRGKNPAGYYNFHYIAVDWPWIGILRKGMKSFITSKFARKQEITRKIADFVGPQNGALGGAVGHFMKTIRMADLNVVTAEYAGHQGRRKTPGHTKTVLASTDPVALDYYAGKHVLLPLGGKKAGYNNPDNPRGTFHKYLELCNAQGIGTLNETEMVIDKFDFNQLFIRLKK